MAATETNCLWELPYAVAVDKIYWKSPETYCFSCLKFVENLITCQGCRQAFYCSEKCMKKEMEDTNLHKFECLAFQKASESPGRLEALKDDTNLRLVARIIARNATDFGVNNDSECSAFKPLCQERKLVDLMSHEENLTVEGLWSIKWKKFEDFYARIPNSPFESVTPKEFLRFYGKVRTNVFSITSFYKVYELPKQIGMGLYMQTSRFDHSCDPPVRIYFENAKLHLKLVDDTKHWKNVDFASLRISYRCWSGTIASCHERMESLKDIFHFWCDCSKCTNLKNDDCLWTALAQECHTCKNPLIPENAKFLPNSDTFTYCNPRCFFHPPFDIMAQMKCTKCDIYGKEKIPLAEFMEHLRNIIFVTMGNSSYDSLNLRPESLENRLEGASRILHPVKNAWLAQAYEIFLSDSLEPEANNPLNNSTKHLIWVKKCVLTGRKLADSYEFFNVGGSDYPTLCAKMGKWLGELGKIDEAIDWYRKAQNIWSKNWCKDHVCISAIETIMNELKQAPATV